MRTTTTILTALALTACAAEPREITERTADVSAVADGNTAFAIDAYQATVETEDGNLFFSPFSISAALSMTLAGAAGDTHTQMADVLHADLEAEWHATFGALIRDLSGKKRGRDYELAIANRLFGQADYPWLEGFLDTTELDYGAPLEEVDFTNETEQARRTINRWVANQTRDRIDELLEPGILDTDTRLALVNAIYFLGDWAEPFEEDATSDQPFALLDGSTVDVPMMSTTFDHVSVGGDELADVLQLPYKGDELSMLVVLPKADDGLPALEAALSVDRLNGWIESLEVQSTWVKMPKIGMRTSLKLKPLLSDLGMPLAFDPDYSDFSAMAPNGGVDGVLYINEVVHEAFVEIDELGTEAAAATAVIMNREYSAPPPPAEFTVDHPYLFLIRDDLTGSTLFIGRVTNPADARID